MVSDHEKSFPCRTEAKSEPSPRTEKALTQKLLVEEEGAGAGPVLIHKLQELSEDSGHMGGSGRDLGTVVSWQTMQTAQVTRERLKKKNKRPNHSSFLHNKGNKNPDV